MRYLYTLFCILLMVRVSAQDSIPWLKASELQKTGYYHNHGFTKSSVAVGLIIDHGNLDEETHLLKINNANINFVYLVDYKTKDTLYKTGDHFPFNSRPIHFWDFIFPFQKNTNQTDSLLLIMDKSGENLSYNLQVYDQKELDVVKSWELILFGGVFAFSMIFTVAFMLLGIMKKEKHNFVFAAFILVSTAWLYNNNGIWFQTVWPNDLILQHIARTILSTFSIGFFVYYFITFYRKDIGPKALQLFKGFIIFLMLRIFIVLTTPQLYSDSNLKYIFQIIGTPLLGIGIVFFLVYLIRFYNKKQFIFHNIGFTIYFIYLVKEVFKLNGFDAAMLTKSDQFISIFSHFFIIAMFSSANIQQYRENKKRKFQKQLEESHSRDMEISEKILEAQEHERTAIGKNIHDQVGGLLSAMKIKMQTTKMKRNDPDLNSEIDQFIEIIDRCSNELHGIVDDLVPPEFEHQDFSEILLARIHLIENATKIKFNYTPVPLDINKTVGLNVYRIISEMITNSFKHSKCTEINISLIREKELLHINFSDNGVGINFKNINKKHGLDSIFNRVKFMNGTIETNSLPGKTFFYIKLPL